MVDNLALVGVVVGALLFGVLVLLYLDSRSGGG